MTKLNLWPLECHWVCRSSPGLPDHLYWFPVLGGKALNAKVGDGCVCLRGCVCVYLLPNPFAAYRPSTANVIITKAVVESNRWGNKP